MNIQISAVAFKPSDSNSLLLVLKNFKNVYDSSSIREEATMWFLSHFISKPANTALSPQMTADREKDREKKGKLMTNFKVVSYCLKM